MQIVLGALCLVYQGCLTLLPGMQVVFNSAIAYGKVKELFIAPEGLYTGQVMPLSESFAT